MTSLNSKLQLALLNRKKSRNLLEKGFTLVELMIVIVIVGVLSSVALPQFLNQRQKAQSTECTAKMASLLQQVRSDYQIDQDASEAMNSIVAGTIATGRLTASPTTAGASVTNVDDLSFNSDNGLFLYTVPPTTTSTDTEAQIKCNAWTSTSLSTTEYPNADADGRLGGKGMHGCINLVTGKILMSRRLEAPGAAYALDCKGSITTPIGTI